MAGRRVKVVEITDEGRDFGKHFRITEMPCDQGEWWAIRAFLAFAKGGIELPDKVTQAGMAGIATMGAAGLLKAFASIDPEQAKPLLDEMWKCVRFQHDPSDTDDPKSHRAMIATDVEDISTRFKIRMAWLELHTGFSLGAKKSTTVLRPEADNESS